MENFIYRNPMEIPFGKGMIADTHVISHELTAFYGIDHAESLAVVMRGLWMYKLAAKSA